MKKIFFALTIILFSTICYSQPVVFNETYSIPAKDSVDVKLGGIYADAVFYSASDSTTVKLVIDTTFQTTRIWKQSDGTEAAATLLASGTYKIVDAVIRTIRFINGKATEKLIELKAGQ